MTSSIPRWFGIARQRVRAEHLLRPADGAEHVDPGLPGRDRLDEELVEVDSALGESELDHAVHRVQADPAEERRQRVPVEANPSAREQRDTGDEEPEVEDELHHPLRPLRERLGRVEAVEAREVDKGEREEERERDERCPGDPWVVCSKRSQAKSRRKTEVRTSDSVSEPASSHWSLWKVTVRIVNRKSPSSTGWTSTRSRAPAEVRRQPCSSRARVPAQVPDPSSSVVSSSTDAASSWTSRDIDARDTFEDDLPAPAPVPERLGADEADGDHAIAKLSRRDGRSSKRPNTTSTGCPSTAGRTHSHRVGNRGEPLARVTSG